MINLKYPYVSMSGINWDLVQTAFLPFYSFISFQIPNESHQCQDSLAAVEFGNTLAKEFSGRTLSLMGGWMVGWLDGWMVDGWMVGWLDG